MSPNLPGTNSAWSKAFAAQALCDLITRDQLAALNAPRCHRLQFLQMGAEKLCKAFLTDVYGISDLVYKHCIVAKTLPLILREAMIERGQNPKLIKAQLATLKPFCREIDMLSPSCHAGATRQDNVEYPWSDQNGIVIGPQAYSFPNLQDEGRDFLVLTKLLRAAAESYLT